MRRRQFMAEMGAWSLAGVAGCCLSEHTSGAYSVSVLGDTHFDGTERSLYHAGYRPEVEWKRRVCEREFRRNAEMWKDRMPRLLASAARCRTADTAFLLHLGDLIQGDCCDYGLHLKMLQEAEAVCRKGFEGLDFRVVCGNHDIREMVTKDGAKAFDEWCGKPSVWMRREMDDAWIFVDFTRPDVESLFAALSDSDGARHTFLVSHGPVSPTDNWGYFWFLLGEEHHTEARRALRRELTRRHAIVLAGHVHCTSLMEWKSAEGSLVQFIANSVWATEGAANAPLVADDPKSFGSLYVNRNARDEPEEYDGAYTTRTRAASLSLMAEYADMTRYLRWNSAGHYRLQVSSDVVDMLFYPGDATTPSMTFALKGSRTI